MSMQSSDEFIDLVSFFFKELLDLGIKFRRLGYAVINQKEKTAEQWVTHANGEVIIKSVRLPMAEHPYFTEIFELWKKRRKGFNKKLHSRQIASFSRFFSRLAGDSCSELKNAWKDWTSSMVWNIAFFKQGYLIVYTEEPLPDAQQKLVRRFATVFEQSYMRLLDLLKSEGQARDLRIEEVLERVRAIPISMQESVQIAGIVQVVYHEIEALNLEADCHNIVFLISGPLR